MTGRIGIVGGVGPLAAAHFYRRLIQLTPVARDEDHLPAVLVSEQVPGRIEHLTGAGDSPVPSLRRAVRTLTDAGATVIAVPSATTHAYLPEMTAVTTVPVLDLLAATAKEVDGDPAIVLATRATVALGLYETYLTDVRYPDQSTVDELIDAVKRGEPIEPLRSALADFVAGFEPGRKVVLGCTELSVINPGARSVVDASDALARATLAAMGLPEPRVVR